MLCSLTFQLPQRPVTVSLTVPHPEERPLMICNWLFLATGELPAAETVRQLWHLAGTNQRHHHPTAATAPLPAFFPDPGLVSFTTRAVAHVDCPGGLMELGSSTTKTVFGGFIMDEPLSSSALRHPALQRAQAFKKGALLCGNAGIANSNASRYYLVLRDLSSAEAEGLRGFAPIGMAMEGTQMDDLTRTLQHTGVHPRTLEPLKPIRLVGCDVQMHLAQGGSGVQAGFTRAQRGGLSAAGGPLTRIAGRQRGREEDESEQPGDASSSGFFQFQFHSGKGAGLQPQKRRRLEVSSEEVNTAILGEEDGEPFDFFKAQELAFGNDLADIKEKQLVKQRKKEQRTSKMSKYHRGSSSSSSKATGQRSGKSSASGKKKLHVKY